MKSIIFLDAVLSTKIITIAYWILLLFVLIFGLCIAMDTINSPWSSQLSESSRYVVALIVVVFGSIIVRLWAEFWVVIFKIQQNTRRAAEALEKRNSNNNPL